jgi:hypothetical protein
MARARSTPSSSAPEAVEVATPLQKLLVGSLLWALILVPLFGFVFYLSPIYKAFPSVYRGDFFILGVGLGVVAAVAFAFAWMTFVPRMIERRAEKRKRADEERRAQRKAASRKGREEE